MTVVFTVPGEPYSKARARVVNGHAYTPAATKAAEKRIVDAWADRRKPFAGPLSVRVTFCAATKVRRDLDNMLKLVLDALNKRAWIDDCQIQHLEAHRLYVPKGEAATHITIHEVQS